MILRTRRWLALAIGAGLLSVLLQLCWPAALALHERIEHAHAASDETHHHDESTCQICQALAHLRSVSAPQLAPIVATQLLSVPLAAEPSAAPHVAVQRTAASPRAPPIV